MEERIRKLEERIQQLEKQQLSFPIDVASMKAIAEGFRSIRIPRLYVDRIFLTTGGGSLPTTEGELVHYTTGGTSTLRVYVNGASKTITTS